MIRRRNARIELGVIVGVLVMALIATGLVVRSHRQANRRPPLFAAAASATAAVGEPTASPSVSPSKSSTGTLQTPDQAVAVAIQFAAVVGAEHPHIVAVDKRNVREAMIAAMRAQESITGPQNYDFGGFPEDELESTAWFVQMDGDEFGSLTCMPGRTCASSPTFAVLMTLDGQLIGYYESVTLPIP